MEEKTVSKLMEKLPRTVYRNILSYLDLDYIGKMSALASHLKVKTDFCLQMLHELDLTEHKLLQEGGFVSLISRCHQLQKLSMNDSWVKVKDLQFIPDTLEYFTIQCDRLILNTNAFLKFIASRKFIEVNLKLMRKEEEVRRHIYLDIWNQILDNPNLKKFKYDKMIVFYIIKPAVYSYQIRSPMEYLRVDYNLPQSEVPTLKTLQANFPINIQPQNFIQHIQIMPLKFPNLEVLDIKVKQIQQVKEIMRVYSGNSNLKVLRIRGDSILRTYQSFQNAFNNFFLETQNIEGFYLQSTQIPPNCIDILSAKSNRIQQLGIYLQESSLQILVAIPSFITLHTLNIIFQTLPSDYFLSYIFNHQSLIQLKLACKTFKQKPFLFSNCNSYNLQKLDLDKLGNAQLSQLSFAGLQKIRDLRIRFKEHQNDPNFQETIGRPLRLKYLKCHGITSQALVKVLETGGHTLVTLDAFTLEFTDEVVMAMIQNCRAIKQLKCARVFLYYNTIKEFEKWRSRIIDLVCDPKKIYSSQQVIDISL